MPIVRRTRADLDLAKVDWARLARTTDAQIEVQIAGDADTSPAFTARELARASRVVPPVAPRSVKAIRQRLGLSQRQFADRYGFSVETVRNYEQGHRRPTGPARVPDDHRQRAGRRHPLACAKESLCQMGTASK